MDGQVVTLMKQNSTPFSVAEYDRQIRKTLPFYEEMYRQVVDVAKVLGLQSPWWLDIGCGTGKMAQTALGEFDIQKMVCVDVESEMLEKVMNYLEGMGSMLSLCRIWWYVRSIRVWELEAVCLKRLSFDKSMECSKDNVLILSLLHNNI